MKKVRWLVMAALLVGLLPAVLPAPVLGMTGSGTALDPYIIWNATDLQDISNNVSAYYQLGQDIDCSCTQTWNWDAGRGVYEGFVPITAFTGSLNGSYYTISNLYMDWYNDRAQAGLFGSLGNGAHLFNLVVENASITNYWTHATASGVSGVLVGYFGSVSVNISRVAVSGEVDNTFNDNVADPAHCNGGAGGLLGYTYGGWGVIEESCAYVEVAAHGNSEAPTHGGGFIGWTYGGSLDVNDCYARGNVTRTGGFGGYGGGFVGVSYHSGASLDVDNCYSTGSATGTDNGFIDYQTGGCGYITDCFWDTETSGSPLSSCGTGKNTTEMKTESTFTSAGWDFTTIWGIYPAINDGYPRLLWYIPDPAVYPDDFTQVQWFQPNTMILGTTLPDRMGNQDGIFSWGSNPAGITIEVDGPYSEYESPTYILPADVSSAGEDMVGPTGNPGWTRDLPQLTGNPFYPLVSVFSTLTGIPISIWWVLLATFFLMAGMLISYKYAPHQIITALIGGAITSFAYALGIYPYWTIFIFVIMALAIIIGERQANIS